MHRTRLVGWLLIGLIVVTGIPIVSAEAPANDRFQRTWDRTDLPVAESAVSRTWMWGPEAFTSAMTEAYSEAPDSQRTVQYYDKARMEDNSWQTDSPPWDITNGLLVVELITGRMQVGDNEFEVDSPAEVNVAGDADDPNGPVYASFATLLDATPLATGAAVTQRIDRQGTTSDDSALADQGIIVATVDEITNHAIATPFWDFMGSEGMIYEGGQYSSGPLFDNRYFATGRPISEPYWANVKVAGTYRDVLMQCFERRCLTFTPDNPKGWQVEASNVGQHYYSWRYESAGPIEGGTETAAAALAGRLERAPTDDARKTVLLDVMDYLHVGVYTTDGQVIVRGAEQGWSDFYLYDFEIQMLAASYGRGQQQSIADVAATLETAGWAGEESPIDPALVAGAIHRGVAGALADQEALDSRSALLIYELGLRHGEPFDLSQPFNWQDVRLDVVQHFLLLAELMVSAVEDQLPLDPTAASNLIELSEGVLKPATHTLQGGICNFPSDQEKDKHGWRKIFIELVVEVPPKLAKAALVFDTMHGVTLAFSVRIQELQQRVESHYGHGGPGERVEFRLKVEMLDDLPDLFVDCGWIVGTSYPAKGPIEDVSVNWSWGNLGQHGQLECGAACVKTGISGLAIDATNAEGIATLVFIPKEEVSYPCEGCWEVEETGILRGIGLYQSKFTNLLGSHVQWAVPKSGASRWFVRWHEPPGYKVTMTVTWDNYTQLTMENHTESSGNSTFEFTVSPDRIIEPPVEGVPSRLLIQWSATGQGSVVGIDESDGDHDAAGDENCNYSWSDEWSGASLSENPIIGNQGQLILTNTPYFEAAPASTDFPEEPGTMNCDDGAHWRAITSTWGWYELEIVPGTTVWSPDDGSVAPNNFDVTWEITVELLQRQPSGDS